MPTKSERPLARVCIRLLQEDYDAIRDIAETTGTVGGINRIIRECIHNYVVRLRGLERINIDKLRQLPGVEP